MKVETEYLKFQKQKKYIYLAISFFLLLLYGGNQKHSSMALLQKNLG